MELKVLNLGKYYNFLGRPYLVSVFTVLTVSLLCYMLKDFMDYRVVAFMLLLTVSILATLFEIIPTLISAVLSAVIWNFFFIKPYYTFHIADTEDTILFLMYFIVALINAVLTYKIKQVQRMANEKESKLNSVKLYNTLLDSLSHELRTPIATIIGATDTLNNPRISKDQSVKLLNEISEASLRLNTQVENLLNMSRLESGVIYPKKDWIDLKELLYSVSNSLKKKFSSHTIDIRVEDNIPLFKLDYGLTQQILYNLIHNALLYTPMHTVIAVEASCRTNQLILTIADQGKGFPEDEIERVFEKFYRLKNTKTGGSGLGLSIVKGFVEAQGGTITLRNLASGGALFTINIVTEVSYLNDLTDD